MVAKLYIHFYAAVVLGCVDDRITNITQKCIKLTIPWIYGSSKCLVPLENPGSKWENMVAFATKIPRISSPGTGYAVFIPADLCLISPPSRLLLFVWSPGGDAHGPSQHVILHSARMTHPWPCFFFQSVKSFFLTLILSTNLRKDH